MLQTVFFSAAAAGAHKAAHSAIATSSPMWRRDGELTAATVGNSRLTVRRPFSGFIVGRRSDRCRTAPDVGLAPDRYNSRHGCRSSFRARGRRARRDAWTARQRRVHNRRSRHCWRPWMTRERCTGIAARRRRAQLDRSLGTAAIVAGLKLDIDSVRAAVMISAARRPLRRRAFGARRCGIAQLVNGVARMSDQGHSRRCSTAGSRRAFGKPAQNAGDGRRHSRGADQARRAHPGAALPRFTQDRDGGKAARERSLFAPLANRLGVYQMGARGSQPAGARAGRTSRSPGYSTSAGSIASNTSKTSRRRSSASSAPRGGCRHFRPAEAFTASGPRCAATTGIGELYGIRAVRIWSTKSGLLHRSGSCTICGRRW